MGTSTSLPVAVLLAASLASQETRRVDAHDVRHGVTVPDPYRWLEAHRSDDVLAWARARSEAARGHLDALPGRDAILTRLRELGSISAPPVGVRYGERWMFRRTDPGNRQSTLYAQSADGLSTPVIDPNPLSEDGSIGLQFSAISPDGRWVAYALGAGEHWYRIRVRDVESGRDLPEVLTDGIHALRLSFCWDPRGRGFYYTRVAGRESGATTERQLADLSIVYHELRTSPYEDRVLVARPDVPDILFYSMRVTRDARHLVVTDRPGRGHRRGAFVMDLEEDDPKPRRLMDWDTALFAYEGSRGSTLYFSTDWQAPKGRIVSLDLTEPAEWREVVPEQDHTFQRAWELADGLACTYNVAGGRALRLYSFDGELVHDLGGDMPGTSFGGLSDQPWNSRFVYSRSTIADPGSLYAIDWTDAPPQHFASPAGLDWDPGDYVTTQASYRSADGTEIPIVLSGPKDLRRDGENAVFLTGFAAFGTNARPRFSPFNMVWLQAGGVLAFPQLRGGNFHGKRWIEAGRGIHKPNAVADYIAAAEWLIDQDYTRPGRLVANSGSGGGILSAAALARRPELFGAGLVDYPMTDLIRYPIDEGGTSMPVEYGPPDDPAVFEALLGYSPYHNVRPAELPPIMVSAGEHDRSTRVWHAYKFVAALQHAQRAAAPIVLRLEWGGQHYPRGTANGNAWSTDQLAFLANAIGLRLGGAAPR